MRLPFSIEHREKIESGEYKVFLANGNPVRILAWDLPGEYPIAAADWPSDNETDTQVETYTEDGSDGLDAELMVETNNPIKPLPIDLLREWSMRYSPDIREEIENTAYHFWNLAMEERQAEIEFRGEEYKQGYEDGKAEALKDLPRWKKCEHEMHTLTHLLIRSIDAMWIGAYVKEGQYYIPTNDLILKLPGFKED